METKSESGILDLEVKLSGDQAQAHKNELTDELRNFAGEVKRQMDKGLAPEEFAVAGKVQEALDAAIEVVTNYKK